MAKPIKQSVPINFAKGLDQKTDPFQVGPENFLELENTTFSKAGLLQKRNGYPQIANTVATPPLSYSFSKIGSTIAAGNTTTPFDGELVALDGMNLFSFAEGGDDWVYKGRAETCRVLSSNIFQNQYNNLMQDSAINTTTGTSVFAWESWTNQPLLQGQPSGIQVSIIDTATGLTIETGSFPSTTSRPKCVSIGSNLYVLYFDSGANDIFALPVSQSGFGSPVSLITDIDTTNTNYDALVFNSLIYIAYNGTGSTVKVASFSSALASVASASKSESASNGVGIFTDASNNAWVAYNNATETKAFIMNSALAVTVLAPTIIDSSSAASGVHNVTGIHDGTRGIIFYDKPGDLALAQQTGFEVDASFVQPAVGSSVLVSTDAVDFTEIGTVIFIPTGGYYYAEFSQPGLSTISVVNLGLPGNAAPGATVAATAQMIYPTGGYSNAITTYNTLTAAGVVGTPNTFVRSCALASRAFLQNGVAHVTLVYDSLIQPTYFVCSLFNVVNPVIAAHVLAKVATAECGGMPYRSLLPSVNTLSTGVYQCAFLQRTFLVQNTSGGVSHPFWFNGVISGTIDCTVANVSKLTLGANLHLGSGTLLMYDGQSTVEHNFHLAPENVTAINNSGGGGFLTAGTYSYIVVYAWVDKQGQTHRSAPSLPVTVVCTNGTYNSLVVPTLRLTEKTSVTIEVYRTEADGSIYYRVDTNPQEFISGTTPYPINNNTAVDSVSFNEGLANVDLTGDQQLYTTGEVANYAAPPVLAMFEYANRIILIPSDDPYTYWFSKQVLPRTPVEFSLSFVKNVGTTGGGLTGGARLDDKMILGKPGSLFYVTGTGPGASGANDDFSDPVFITADAGIINHQSIANSPFGVFFRSSKGIYLLQRNLVADFVGAPVSGYNSQSVVAARAIPGTNQLRFMLSGGPTLMFDYYYGQWGTFSNPTGVSDCIYAGAHTYINSSGLVFVQDPASYTDGTATPVLMSFKTSWIKLAGLQGYQRAYFFYLLASYLSPHQLSLAIAYNFSDTASQTSVITPNSANALENWRVFLAQQRCQSFQIALTEVYTGTPGAGFTMSGLNLLVGAKSAFRTIPSAQTVG